MFSFHSFSQNRWRTADGDYIGASFHGFYSRYYGEIYYLKRFKNATGISIGICGGEFGDFKADGKTKDWFGHIDYSDFSGTYYLSNNIGLQIGTSYSYEFDISNIVKIDVGLLLFAGYYNVKHELDYIGFNDEDEWGYHIEKESANQFNMGFGFNANAVILVFKQFRATAGFKLPFYLLNPNHFSIGKFFDPPLLGFEPVLSIGIRYKLNTKK